VLAGGSWGKRIFKKYTTGSAVPLTPIVNKKKNNHRGPKKGCVYCNKKKRPTHPIVAMRMDVNSIEGRSLRLDFKRLTSNKLYPKLNILIL
jgi:hypothetical protein